MIIHVVWVTVGRSTAIADLSSCRRAAAAAAAAAELTLSTSTREMMQLQMNPACGHNLNMIQRALFWAHACYP